MKQRNIFTFLLMFVFIVGITISGCKKDPIDPDPDPDPDPTPTEKAFVGSDQCKTCHSAKYNSWIESGHPYKFSVVTDGTAPEYPAWAVNFIDDWLTTLGDGSLTWDNIAGVIGGYGWKARFVGTDGHIVGTLNSIFNTAGGNNQINFYGGELHGWADYHPSDEKIYNYSCFKCHTTGGNEEGTWLDGVDGLGTFTEGGIGCESCHGPGSLHVDDPSTDNIDRVYEFAHSDNASGGLTVDGVVQTPNETGNDVNFLCGTCHNRGYDNSIDSKGGFIKHHEQWDELVSGVHSSLNCSSCHDPHERTIWDGNGITGSCTDCHSGITQLNHSASADCIDCHMPFAAKSGTTIGASGFEGDIRSHLMKILVDDESIFVADGSAVRNDGVREAALNVEFACLGCHNRDAADGIPNKTAAEAITDAANMHVAK